MNAGILNEQHLFPSDSIKYLDIASFSVINNEKKNI